MIKKSLSKQSYIYQKSTIANTEKRIKLHLLLHTSRTSDTREN